MTDLKQLKREFYEALHRELARKVGTTPDVVEYIRKRIIRDKSHQILVDLYKKTYLKKERTQRDSDILKEKISNLFMVETKTVKDWEKVHRKIATYIDTKLKIDKKNELYTKVTDFMAGNRTEDDFAIIAIFASFTIKEVEESEVIE